MATAEALTPMGAEANGRRSGRPWRRAKSAKRNEKRSDEEAKERRRRLLGLTRWYEEEDDEEELLCLSQVWHPRVRVRVWRKPARRQTRGIGKNPPASKPAGAFLHPHPHPRISGGFRVPAGLTTDIIKMYKFINLNSQITHFYK